jgi:hypothetical protein
VTSDGAEKFEVTGPAGGVSGRANDHCKTSTDMLSPGCPDALLQYSTVSRSQASMMCAASARMRRARASASARWTVSATEFISQRQRRAGPNASRTGPLGATGTHPGHPPLGCWYAAWPASSAAAGTRRYVGAAFCGLGPRSNSHHPPSPRSGPHRSLRPNPRCRHTGSPVHFRVTG